LSARTKRRAALGAIAVVLAILLVRAVSSGAAPAGQGGETAVVHREDLVVMVDHTGVLKAVRATDLGPPVIKNIWDFKISFLAPESMPAKKGQPILAFDAQQLERMLEEKQAELAEVAKQTEKRGIDLKMALLDADLTLADAEARLRKAQLKAEVPPDLTEGLEARTARLDVTALEREVASGRAKVEATRGAGEADLRALKSRRDRAAARVDELKASIATMTVLAPQDGIVIYKTDWNGQKSKVGDSAWAGAKVLELPDLSEMKAIAEVDEADAGRIAAGQKATVRLEAYPDIDFAGTVRTIGTTVRRKGWNDPNKIYLVEIALDKTDSGRMRPAMRFRGQIETGRIPSLLVAPREAVHLRQSGPIVWIDRGGRWVEVPVRTGRSNKRFVELVAGAEEGARLSLADLAPPEPEKVGGPVLGMAGGR